MAWFVGQGIATFALFGRRRDLAIAAAGPDKTVAYREVARKLVALGHRRIVLLAMKARRLPEPGLPERAFLDELGAHGIPTGPYNLPDWEENPECLQNQLDSLFQLSPPTAFLIDEAYLFHAVKHHLAEKGLGIPGDVSLICTNPDRTLVFIKKSVLVEALLSEKTAKLKIIPPCERWGLCNPKERRNRSAVAMGGQ